jgi:hypothetical protein
MEFGDSVAISTDGNTIAVGAIGDSSNATGVNGDQSQLNGMQGAGAVFVFVRSGSSWTQAAYIKPSLDTLMGSFGRSVALSSDGTTLAVGEPGDAGTTTGINSTPNQLGNDNGSVSVFTLSAGMWSQQAYIKPAVTHNNDEFGGAIALSQDGITLAVGALLESSAATGVNGDATSTGAADSGAAYVFTSAAGTWSQQAYIKASNTQSEAWFGQSVVLSAAGDELVVGSPSESSSATGIGGDQNNTSAPNAGAAYVFALSGGTWSQQAYVKASNTASADRFGTSLGLSGDGNTLAIGANDESSDATGLDGDQTNTSASQAGAAYLFTRSGSTWSQQHYVKASNPRAMAHFGESAAVSSDGSTYAFGAPGDSSDATGVNGSETDTSAPNEGAAYVFPP